MNGRHLWPWAALAAWLLAPATSHEARAQTYELGLRAIRPGVPNVMAALDPDAALGRELRPVNPFVYECVAFLQVRHADAGPLRLLTSGPHPWSRNAVWIEPANDPTRRQHPRLVTFVADHHTVVVTLAPENSKLEYVVRVDSAAVVDSGPPPVTVTVRDLASDPFSIPQAELEQCGRVPDVDVNVLAPDGQHAGFNVDFDVAWRRTLRLGGGGLFQFSAQGATTTAEQSTLLNSLTAGARLDVKLNKGWRRWISVGASEGLEATESFDVVDLALGASSRIRLDFLPVAALRPLLHRFTPYPMLTLEYNLVDRVKGEGAPEVAGRPDTEHRLRAALAWTVPFVMNTTVRAQARADYLLSDIGAGQRRLRTLYDVKVEYPLNSAQDVALVVERLEGRAPPAYSLAVRWLTGLGIRL